MMQWRSPSYAVRLLTRSPRISADPSRHMEFIDSHSGGLLKLSDLSDVYETV